MNVGFQGILLKMAVAMHAIEGADLEVQGRTCPFGLPFQAFKPGLEVDRCGFASRGRTLALNWQALRDQLGQPTQILYSGGQRELVFGAAESSAP